MQGKMSAQRGFTLVELMIAIALGLIVSAAALMIFLSSQRSLALQGGMGEIQQNSIFGLAAVTRDLRHINLDTESDYISKTQVGSGIVFDPTQVVGITLTDEQITTAAAHEGAMTTNNDQLTVQYRVRTADMYNCEGALLDRDALNVQRYFVQALPASHQPADWANVADARTRYGLYCDAANTGANNTGMNTGATLIVPDVEAFKVSLGARSLNGTPVDRQDDFVRYLPLGEYIASPYGDTVVSVEIGILARSSNSVHRGNLNPSNKFMIAGQEVELDATVSKDNYLRVPISQVIAIRNSQGVE